MLVVACVAALSALAFQQPPAIHGLTGTIATEGSIEQFYDGTNKLLVKAGDGVDHLFHLNHKTDVHNGNATDKEALHSLKKGTRVVVHYSTDGSTLNAEEIDELGEHGLNEIQGVVTKVDRHTRMISLRLADGTTETLRLSDRAAAGVGQDIDSAVNGAVRVAVYYRNESGQRVVHYFKRI
jgi:hypothetical protein